MAPPVKLSEKVSGLICAGLRVGATLDDAGAVAGVSRPTIYRWVKIGDETLDYLDRQERGVVAADDQRVVSDHELACAGFAEAVREARSSFMLEHADNVVRAAMQSREKKITTTRTVTDAHGRVLETHTETRVEEIPPDAKASMWLLERRFPKAFGGSGRLEISGPDGGEIPIPTDAMREQLLAKLTEIHALAPPPEVIDVDEVTVEEELADLRASLGMVPDAARPGEPPETAQDPSNDEGPVSAAEGDRMAATADEWMDLPVDDFVLELAYREGVALLPTHFVPGFDTHPLLGSMPAEIAEVVDARSPEIAALFKLSPRRWADRVAQAVIDRGFVDGPAAARFWEHYRRGVPAVELTPEERAVNDLAAEEAIAELRDYVRARIAEDEALATQPGFLDHMWGE